MFAVLLKCMSFSGR